MLKRMLIGFSLVILINFIFLYGVSPELTQQEREWLNKATRLEKNGWIFLHTEGAPFERGFQRGYLTAKEITGFLETLYYIEKFNTAKESEFFVKTAAKLFTDRVPQEYIEEMKGIVSGVEKAGEKITYAEMLFMNGFIDIIDYWLPQAKVNEALSPGCSAFIATGKSTADGKIVMAHNTWSYYATIRFSNIILDIIPDKGHRILMQTWGPCIYSATDFFITSAGLVGTETTMLRFSGYNPDGIPVFIRARRAMQYADSIDQWADIMKENSNGAYACSWLLGDIKTNEIGRFELGLKNHSLEKKKDGYFSGSNIVNNIKILREETSSTCDDIRDFCVARRVRWKQLMKMYYGKIDVDNAKKMLADHYDVYLKKDQPGCRGICGHLDLDNGMIPNSTDWSAYFPAGTMDGKVVDSGMAKKWRIWAKWGSPCGIGFNAEKYLEEHPQYEWLKGFLEDIPSESWTVFPLGK